MSGDAIPTYGGESLAARLSIGVVWELPAQCAGFSFPTTHERPPIIAIDPLGQHGGLYGG